MYFNTAITREIWPWPYIQAYVDRRFGSLTYRVDWAEKSLVERIREILAVPMVDLGNQKIGITVFIGLEEIGNGECPLKSVYDRPSDYVSVEREGP